MTCTTNLLTLPFLRGQHDSVKFAWSGRSRWYSRAEMVSQLTWDESGAEFETQKTFMLVW